MGFFTGKIAGYWFELKTVSWGLLKKISFNVFRVLLKIWHKIEATREQGLSRKIVWETFRIFHIFFNFFHNIANFVVSTVIIINNWKWSLLRWKFESVLKIRVFETNFLMAENFFFHFESYNTIRIFRWR